MNVWQIIGLVSLCGQFVFILIWAFYHWIKCGNPKEDLKNMARTALPAILFLFWLIGSSLLVNGDIP